MGHPVTCKDCGQTFSSAAGYHWCQSRLDKLERRVSELERRRADPLPTLESLITYGTADEWRKAYAPTPVAIRRLFVEDASELETDAWLVRALQADAVPLLEVPGWINDLAGGVEVPTIRCDPSKSPGAWRLYHRCREWYQFAQELARALP